MKVSRHDDEASGGGALAFNVLALNATLPLYAYKAAFPIVATVIAGEVETVLGLRSSTVPTEF